MNKRTLTNWYIKEIKDLTNSYLQLCGIVELDKSKTIEKPLALGATLRITSTSPIVECNNDHVVTESGSIYYVEGPPSLQHLFFLSKYELYFNEQIPFPISLLDTIKK